VIYATLDDAIYYLRKTQQLDGVTETESSPNQRSSKVKIIKCSPAK
jgi:hypothetical protein